ncbi:MAG: PIG-L family deacetylase [Cyclobacteriaceae bacterium]|jgi:LmbE family N-acetylglucosaminyl deacetylase|nr:PIG-L family deacetylase [Cyclobacteriaceae bacterium]
MDRRVKRIFLLFQLLPVLVFGQPSSQPDAARIRLNMMKLNFLGSVLYVAAHPDDENTRVITYMANDQLAATAYLSMTRGDGGQNLIGPEIRDKLGLIRTHELLSARRIDGGQQFFTRAVDFGYSKSAEETFRIWGKEEILSDVVRVYRMFKPDVILTRFPADERAGHGHHTASAVLAAEAFDMASRDDFMPLQVREFGLAKPVRLYTNTGRWWNTTINEETPGVVALDVGKYNPLLGASYTEIAAVSRSQHKSQGFGAGSSRGEEHEFFEYVKGDRCEEDLFEGINTTWTRVEGGAPIQRLVEEMIAAYDVTNPAASVPALLNIRKAIASLKPGIWKERKLAEVNQLIQDCLGLYCGATAKHYYAVPGEPLTVNFEFVNRSDGPVVVESIRSDAIPLDTLVSAKLEENVVLELTTSHPIDGSIGYSDPYWLQEPHDIGRFTVKDGNLIGMPENPPAISFTASLRVHGEPLSVDLPLNYRWVDPVKGEQVRPVEVVPAIDISLPQEVVIFESQDPRDIRVTVHSNSTREVSGELKLELPQGWKYTPSSLSFTLKESNATAVGTFTVVPPRGESVGRLRAVARVGEHTLSRSLETIAYDHFPIQTLLPEASSKIVRLDIAREGQTIGYIEGAGDEVPQALRSIGYDVRILENQDITPETLARLDAVVVGVRALSTRDGIERIMSQVLKYVEGGGTAIVQYNNDTRLDYKMFAPYPLKLSRERVSEEDAEVRILVPDHPALNTPNKITARDFEGWVQERGLYFPSSWDQRYSALLSMNDKNEPPRDGSLLVASYGKGYYVYTGLSFFRELPEGVPGAYRLFANLVSLGKGNRTGTSSSRKNR